MRNEGYWRTMDGSDSWLLISQNTWIQFPGHRAKSVLSSNRNNWETARIWESSSNIVLTWLLRIQLGTRTKFVSLLSKPQKSTESALGEKFLGIAKNPRTRAAKMILTNPDNCVSSFRFRRAHCLSNLVESIEPTTSHHFQDIIKTPGHCSRLFSTPFHSDDARIVPGLSQEFQIGWWKGTYGKTCD